MKPKETPPDSIFILEGEIVPVFRGDNLETLVNRIDNNNQIPYSKKIIDGKIVLIRDHILNEIMLDFKIET